MKWQCKILLYWLYYFAIYFKDVYWMISYQYIKSFICVTCKIKEPSRKQHACTYIVHSLYILHTGEDEEWLNNKYRRISRSYTNKNDLFKYIVNVQNTFLYLFQSKEFLCTTPHRIYRFFQVSFIFIEALLTQCLTGPQITTCDKKNTGLIIVTKMIIY